MPILSIDDLFNQGGSVSLPPDDDSPFGMLESLAEDRRRRYFDGIEELPHGIELSSNFDLCEDASIPQLPKSYAQIDRLFEQLTTTTLPLTGLTPESRDELHKSGGRLRAVNNIAQNMTQQVQFVLYKDGLYYYAPPRWRFATLETFTRLVRREAEDTEMLDNLAPADYKMAYQQIRTMPEQELEHDDIDFTPALLNCQDAVYDVRRERVVPHNPKWFFRTSLNVLASEINDSGGEMTEQYLDTLTGGDRQLRSLLLEIIFVVLSGYNPKAMFVLLGEKNSGKSSLLRLLTLLVGQECVVDLNSLNDLSSNQWLLINFIGKKLAACGDQEHCGLNARTVGLLKKLTGGDMVQGEQKYQDPVWFYSEATIVVASNFPLIAPNDSAFWERVKTVPFPYSIPKSEQIPDVEKRLFEQEAGYIVYIACQAGRSLIRRGFVFTEVNDLPISVDTVGDGDRFDSFIDTQCLFDSEATTATDELYSAYSAFCDGNTLMSKIDFGRRLRLLNGITEWRKSTIRGVCGIRLSKINTNNIEEDSGDE
jgi:P4 family phage/plasmid primase-like protien